MTQVTLHKDRVRSRLYDCAVIYMQNVWFIIAIMLIDCELLPTAQHFSAIYAHVQQWSFPGQHGASKNSHVG